MKNENASGNSTTTSGRLMGSIITIIIVMVVVTTTVTYTAAHLATQSSSHAPSTTSSITPALAWSNSSSYPSEIWTESCVAWGGFIYCVGGLAGAALTDITNAVYFAPLSPSGVGHWTETTSYPMNIRSESCVASASKIYCIGGYNDSALTADAFFASLSSTGVGSWKNTTSYPTGISTQSCAPSSQGVYCVGGETPSGDETNAVNFAPFSSSGLGSWSVTAAYPVAIRQQSCVASSSDLYCIGGLDYTSVNFAPLTSTGVGQWTNTTAYPFTVGANLLSCTTVGSEVYCVAGHTGPNVSSDVYQAPLSASGLGLWVADASYTVAVWGLSCVSSNGAIYCAGGETASDSITNTVAYFQTS